MLMVHLWNLVGIELEYPVALCIVPLRVPGIRHDNSYNNNNNNNNNNNRFDLTDIISTCPILAKEQYIQTRDSVC
jgi:hypothetical protein